MRAVVVGSLTELESLEQEAFRSCLDAIDVLEVRADLVGEVDSQRLRQIFGGRLLWTLRSVDEGGESRCGDRDRSRKLALAASHFDLVDLECARDLGEEILSAVKPQQRVLSWHGEAVGDQLASAFEVMRSREAALYKLVVTGPRGSETSALDLYRRADRETRPKMVCFALGAAGVWTRLLAPFLGAPWLYGAISDKVAAPGQPSVSGMVADYGLPELREPQKLFGVVGAPVIHSLSPRIHNAGYRDHDVPALYLPFEARDWSKFWDLVNTSWSLREAVAPLCGLSVTTPHKESALLVGSLRSENAQRTEAANTLLALPGPDGPRRPVEWKADCTDPQGITGSLKSWRVPIAGSRVGVVGAGGAGRAAAFGLHQAGAAVTLVNRTRSRGESAAMALGVPFVASDDYDPSKSDIVVNATSLGRAEGDELPFDPSRMKQGSTVIEMVYQETPTALERAAGDLGLRVIGGREVLLQQAKPQFRAMCGEDLDLAATRARIGAPEPSAVRAG